MTTLQEQRKIQSFVFGPYDSRRFGRSLGVNMLPAGARICNFDCIYCECANAGGSWPPQWELRPAFPTAEEVYRELVARTAGLDPEELDAITITGNGEPTLAPGLSEIIDVVTEVRDRDWPQARTVILTNGTMCHKPRVRSALARLDERAVKLDAGDNWMLEQMNRPDRPLTAEELLRRIAMTADITVQSMFVHGPIDNTTPKEVEAWTERLVQVAPRCVQIFSLDRPPAKSWVRQVSRPELERIAAYVQSQTSIPVKVF